MKEAKLRKKTVKRKSGLDKKEVRKSDTLRFERC